jgi:hypothetical protein
LLFDVSGVFQKHRGETINFLQSEQPKIMLFKLIESVQLVLGDQPAGLNVAFVAIRDGRILKDRHFKLSSVLVLFRINVE